MDREDDMEKFENARFIYVYGRSPFLSTIRDNISLIMTQPSASTCWHRRLLIGDGSLRTIRPSRCCCIGRILFFLRIGHSFGSILTNFCNQLFIFFGGIFIEQTCLRAFGAFPIGISVKNLRY